MKQRILKTLNILLMSVFLGGASQCTMPSEIDTGVHTPPSAGGTPNARDVDLSSDCGPHEYVQERIVPCYHSSGDGVMTLVDKCVAYYVPAPAGTGLPCILDPNRTFNPACVQISPPPGQEVCEPATTSGPDDEDDDTGSIGGYN